MDATLQHNPNFITENHEKICNTIQRCSGGIIKNPRYVQNFRDQGAPAIVGDYESSNAVFYYPADEKPHQNWEGLRASINLDLLCVYCLDNGNYILEHVHHFSLKGTYFGEDKVEIWSGKKHLYINGVLDFWNPKTNQLDFEKLKASAKKQNPNFEFVRPPVMRSNNNKKYNIEDFKPYAITVDL